MLAYAAFSHGAAGIAITSRPFGPIMSVTVHRTIWGGVELERNIASGAAQRRTLRPRWIEMLISPLGCRMVVARTPLPRDQTMKSDFKDIRDRIAEEPTWFDAIGTPRYGPFDPELCPDIYANEVLLVEIGCQACKKQFMVEMHTDRWLHSSPALSGMIKEGNLGYIHYGDPPYHNCVGDTMNCLDIKVIEFWSKDTSTLDWIRVPELEINLPDKEV